MDKSSFNLSNGRTVGADQDRSLETDAALSLSPEIDSLVGEGAALPPAAEAFIAKCGPEMAKRCRVIGLAILSIERQTSAGRIDNGLLLIELKADKSECKHGQFTEFVEALGFHIKDAGRCMRVARHFGQHRDLMSGVIWSALCDLTAKEVPQAVRDEVIARRRAGEHLTRKDIQSLISEASRAMSRPVTKTDRSGPPKTSPSPSEERPDPPTAVPDRSRAVALLARSDSSVISKTNEFAVTMSDVQPPIDGRPDLARSTARAVELLPAPQTMTMPSQEPVDVPAVLYEDLRALSSPVQPDNAVSENMIEPAPSTSGTHKSDGEDSGTAMSASQAVDLLSGKVTREEALELYYCWKGAFSEFVRLFGQRYGVAEADARVMGDECGNRTEVS
jgi:hypothetical protein